MKMSRFLPGTFLLTALPIAAIAQTTPGQALPPAPNLPPMQNVPSVPPVPTPPTPLPKKLPPTDLTGVKPSDIKPVHIFDKVPPGQPLTSDPTAIRTIDDAISTAFQRNPGVLQAIERAIKTQKAVEQIYALGRPQLSIGGNYSRLANASSQAAAASSTNGQITNPFVVGLTSAPPGSNPITLTGGSNNSNGSAGATALGGSGQSSSTTTTATSSTASSSRAELLPGTGRQTPGTGGTGTGGTGTGGTGTGGTGTTGTGGTGTTGTGSTGTGTTAGDTSSRNSSSNFGNAATLNQVSARVSLTQYIDITGIVGTTISVGKLEEALTRFDLARVRQDTALNVRTTYYNLLRSIAFVGVNEAAVADSEELLRVTQAQKNAGIVSDYDVLRSRTQLDNNRQALINSRNQVAVSKNALANLIGIDPSTVVEPAVPPIPPVPPLDEAALIATALAQRPEYFQADANLLIASKNIRLAHRNLEPSLSASINGNYNATASAFTAEKASGSFGLALTIPLYDGGSTKAAVESARADERIARIQKDQFVRGIKAEVQQAVIAVRDAAERSQSTAGTVTQSQEALRLANVRFKAGVGTQLEINDAQSTLITAETNAVNAQYDYLGALARLSRAIGNPE